MNGNIKKINNVKPVNIWRKVIIRRENKMKKKVIALALTACMVPVGSGVDVMAAKGDSGDKITLNWQSYDSYDKYQKVVEAFEKENPDIEINFEEVSDYATKILTEATAGDLPDLINCNTGTTQILANAGACLLYTSPSPRDRG